MKTQMHGRKQVPIKMSLQHKDAYKGDMGKDSICLSAPTPTLAEKVL